MHDLGDKNLKQISTDSWWKLALNDNSCLSWSTTISKICHFQIARPPNFVSSLGFPLPVKRYLNFFWPPMKRYAFSRPSENSAAQKLETPAPTIRSRWFHLPVFSTDVLTLLGALLYCYATSLYMCCGYHIWHPISHLQILFRISYSITWGYA